MLKNFKGSKLEILKGKLELVLFNNYIELNSSNFDFIDMKIKGENFRVKDMIISNSFICSADSSYMGNTRFKIKSKDDDFLDKLYDTLKLEDSEFFKIIFEIDLENEELIIIKEFKIKSLTEPLTCMDKKFKLESIEIIL